MENIRQSKVSYLSPTWAGQTQIMKAPSTELRVTLHTSQPSGSNTLGRGSTFPYGSPAVIYEPKHHHGTETQETAWAGVRQGARMRVTLRPSLHVLPQKAPEPPEIAEKLSRLRENLSAFLSSESKRPRIDGERRAAGWEEGLHKSPSPRVLHPS